MNIVFIIASSYTIAQAVAKNKDIPKSEWEHLTRTHQLRGTRGATVLVANDSSFYSSYDTSFEERLAAMMMQQECNLAKESQYEHTSRTI